MEKLRIASVAASEILSREDLKKVLGDDFELLGLLNNQTIDRYNNLTCHQTNSEYDE